VPLIFVHGHRGVARLFVGVVLVTAYETLFVVTKGATPGKMLAGTKVAQLDASQVEPGLACKRGLLVAVSALVVVLAPLLAISGFGALGGHTENAGAVIGVAVIGLVLAGAIVLSVFASPMRRSFIDRVCDTVVVVRDMPARIDSATLEPYAKLSQPPAPSPWGPLARFDERRRARAGRLDNAPVLVLVLVAVVFSTSVPHLAPAVVAVLAVGWELVFVLDETWRVSRYGGTSGHIRHGLAVVDVATGEPPAPLNCLVRALLVSLPLYVLPLGIIVCAELRHDHPAMVAPMILFAAMILGFLLSLRLRPGRGLHDLAAGTMVVTPHRLRDVVEID
jgi:uncharacterized RDD family membrane protein YckC